MAPFPGVLIGSFGVIELEHLFEASLCGFL